MIHGVIQKDLHQASKFLYLQIFKYLVGCLVIVFLMSDFLEEADCSKQWPMIGIKFRIFHGGGLLGLFKTA